MLTIRNVTKRYSPDVVALSRVNLHLGNGMFGLLGPNGAGKTTLMRILATLLTPDSGDVSFDGMDLLSEPDRVRPLLGYLPQDHGFYPSFRVLDMLEYLAALRGLTRRERRQRALECLERVNLREHRSVRVGELSGGMRQRLGIAQALLGRPRLLIVDEPTAGLDPEERLRLHDMLAALGSEVVVLMSTHIVSDVAVLCSRMAILHGGAVLVEGSPVDVVATLGGRVFEGVVPTGRVSCVSARFRVLSKLTLSSSEVALRVYSEVGLPAPEFTPSRGGSLEDAYFVLVGAAAGRA